VIYFERKGGKYRKYLWSVRALLSSTVRLDWSLMQKRRILIVDNNDELRVILESVMGNLGHDVVVTGDRGEALGRDDLDEFDVIISDLTEEVATETARGEAHRKHVLIPIPAGTVQPELIRAFKLAAVDYLRLPYDTDQFRQILEQTLSYKLRYADNPALLQHTHEKIEFEIPSDLALMEGVLKYLLERVSKLGLIEAEGSNLFVALDEAFVNAVKHGNKNDPAKLLRVAAEITPTEASFTIEDQGEGFDVGTIPDPCDPANLFKSSGRGVLLMYNIMDEVEYNAQGNRVKMVKRPERSVEPQLVEPGTSNDKHARNV
jgi:serine/threonine-protein kinase RsbW